MASVKANLSRTTHKAEALLRLRANEWLQRAALAPAQQYSGDLSVDQPSQPLDGALILAAVAALEGGETHYADVPGIAPLRKAVAMWMNKTLAESEYTSDQVLITAGIQEARFLTIQVLGHSLGPIALPEVLHPGVRQALAMRKIDSMVLPVSQTLGLLPALDAIRAVLEAGAQTVFLESPSRLTGAIYTPSQVRELGALIATYGAAVIWDQGLAPWVTPQQYLSLTDTAAVTQRVATIGELWPGIGLESWQIGYIGAPIEWVKKMQVNKQLISICTNTAVQYAALAAADMVIPAQRNVHARLSAVKQAIVNVLSRGGIAPVMGAAANILALPASDAADALTRAQKVILSLADGALFGAPGLLRLAVTPVTVSLEAVKYVFSTE